MSQAFDADTLLGRESKAGTVISGVDINVPFYTS